MTRNGWNLLEMSEMTGNGLKWLEMAGMIGNGWKCLKIPGMEKMTENCWNGWNGWKVLEMAVNSWKFLY